MENGSMKLNKKLLFILSASLLMMTQTAHADFRKALDAYIARDGATMFKEVKEAVEKKNDDGLILFLNVLELDNMVARSRMFTFSEEIEINDNLEKVFKQGKEIVSPWTSMLSPFQLDSFNFLLEKATKQSSLESQYRLLSLQHAEGYTVWPGKKQEQLISGLKELGEQGYVNVYPYLADVEKEKSEPEKLLSYKKGVALGQTKLLLLNSTDYLLGNKSKKIDKNEKQGLQLLALGLSKPDAEFYYADIANKVCEFYLNKGTKQAQQQAYLWSLVALTTSRTGLVPSSLIELKKAGILKQIAPELDANWTSNIKALKLQNKVAQDADEYKLASSFNLLPIQLKEIKYFVQPELIAKNQKIDLQKQPVLSFHHFYYDQYYIVETAPVRNYLIDIYADGRVNFSLGSRLNPTQNTETLTRITPQEVQNLVSKVHDFGFENAPLHANSKNAANCGMASCDEVYDRVGAQNSFYYMTLRGKQSVKTIMLHNREGDDLTSFFAKTFKLFESQFHTQNYRCSTLKTRDYYQYCVEQDKRFFEIAKQGEKK